MRSGHRPNDPITDQNTFEQKCFPPFQLHLNIYQIPFSDLKWWPRSRLVEEKKLKGENVFFKPTPTRIEQLRLQFCEETIRNTITWAAIFVIFDIT
jgi:hypothetical protein